MNKKQIKLSERVRCQIKNTMAADFDSVTCVTDLSEALYTFSSFLGVVSWELMGEHSILFPVMAVKHEL